MLWIRLWEWGGVGIACKYSNREFIGIEIDEKYFNIAQKRINEANVEAADEAIVEKVEEPSVDNVERQGQLTFF